MIIIIIILKIAKKIGIKIDGRRINLLLYSYKARKMLETFFDVLFLFHFKLFLFVFKTKRNPNCKYNTFTRPFYLLNYRLSDSDREEEEKTGKNKSKI